jgi:hypothetical protein
MKKIINLIFTLLGLAIIPLSATAVGLTLPDTIGVTGDMIDIPVIVEDDLTGQGIVSYQLQVNYTNSRLILDDVISTGTLTETMGSFSYNQTADNQVQISAAASSPLSGKGKLIILRFIMHTSGTATLAFTDTLNNFFNEGSPSVLLQNGRIVITNPPVITVNPNSALLAVGETLNLSVSGGTAPYTWSLTVPGTGAIVTTGTNTAQFTASASGFTRVVARDDNDIVDTTNSFIEIRPVMLDLPDSVISQGQVVDIPILSSNLTGLGIISGQLKLQYSANILQVTEVLTDNSILSSYPDVSYNVGTGNVTISFAGTTPLSGSGVLCYVRMASNFNYSGTSNLSLSDVVFNENLLAKLYTGSCRVNQLPALSISPSTTTLFTGETLPFTVTNGGVDPLVWSTSNTDVATITSDGLLTALRGGQVNVTVTDAANAKGSSGTINIYDTQISIPDTLATISSYIDLPVYIDSIRSSDMVYSVQGTFAYDTTKLTIINILTEGAIGTNWTYAVNIEENHIIFAGAGVNGVRTAGKIATLRFLVKASLNNGGKTLVSFQDVLLNEGRPAAFIKNGSITGSVSDIPPVPMQISPLEGASVAPDAAVFVWTLSVGTQSYQLQIDTANDFSAPVIDFNNIVDTTHIVSTLNDLTTYYWRIRATNVLGESAWSSTRSFQTTVNGIVEINSKHHPNQFVLEQNYPNPFNPNTTIEFAVPRYSMVKLEIFNALGERIDVLVNQGLAAGNYCIQWNAENAASGIYYYRLTGQNFTNVKRMLLIQ